MKSIQAGDTELRNADVSEGIHLVEGGHGSLNRRIGTGNVTLDPGPNTAQGVRDQVVELE